MASSSKWAPYMLVCLLFKISEDNDDEHDHCSTKMNITTNKGQELWKSQDVEDFVPVYQDTTNPASQFRTLLANTGFAIKSASSFPQDLILNFYLKEMWGRSVHFHFPEPKRTSFSAEVLLVSLTLLLISSHINFYELIIFLLRAVNPFLARIPQVSWYSCQQLRKHRYL